MTGPSFHFAADPIGRRILSPGCLVSLFSGQVFSPLSASITICEVRLHEGTPPATAEPIYEVVDQ